MSDSMRSKFLWFGEFLAVVGRSGSCYCRQGIRVNVGAPGRPNTGSPCGAPGNSALGGVNKVDPTLVVLGGAVGRLKTVGPCGGETR